MVPAARKPSLPPQFEAYLKQVAHHGISSEDGGLSEMVAYQFGWDEPQRQAGKRLRPLLCITVAQALGQPAESAFLPAALLEIIHNYTLIHDDVEDNGEFRHGRPALWKAFGLAQAVNTGDYLLSQALVCNQAPPIPYAAVWDKVSREIILDAAKAVVVGQFRDISFTTSPTITQDQYLGMIALKTGALFSAAFATGAHAAGAENLPNWAELGTEFGVCYQQIDDYLGIWGDPTQIGKSASSDLIQHKQSLPVIIGLEKSPRFKKLYSLSLPITEPEAEALAGILAEDGVQTTVKEMIVHQRSRLLMKLQENLSENSQAANSLVDLVSAILAF